MAHTHTRTFSDTHIDNRCVRWNGRASTIVFTCKCKRFPPFHFLPPLLALTPSPSNIYMQIDRTLVPLPFSRCHSERERHTQKEISTKRQMLQYYRALALSASVPWVAAANAGGCARLLCPVPSSCLCFCLPLPLPVLTSCLPCYALKWQKNRWSRKNYCSWQLEADISHSQADAVE